ncbi:glutamate racemase [Kocuria sp. AG109]|uniref:glutamate racemase n=2 Tax=Rothia kristinae TaxID=37923 RepID=UPI0009BD3E95|nr:glutamate racemase [Rothia kristinae]MCA1169541.1 glutamate racemase [Rothia kristinae]MED6045860.1 glutamate racemase [Rothia kristinae]TDP56841.1 glutamate racemase [Kocuria sp. AG109]WGH10156.1 glutamate racemase [Rothia kristinae]
MNSLPDQTDAVTAWGSAAPARPTPGAPIGVFDSGVGGLTVARAIMDQLPHEQILYVGDTAHGPYGPLSIAQVRANALRIMDDLVDSGVKALVIACNTASSAVLRDARERYTRHYGIPVVEVIQPAVRRAVAATRNDVVGVLGTVATVSSRAYEDTFAAAPQLRIVSEACPEFVEFVERGITSGPELLEAVRTHLAPLQEAGVDTVVLGCTHYPLLTGVISYVLGEEVTLVTSSEETAKDLFRALMAQDLQRPADAPAPRHEFVATGDPERFQALARRFLGPEVLGVRHSASIAESYPTGSLAVVTPEMIRTASVDLSAVAATSGAAAEVAGAAGTDPGPRSAAAPEPDAESGAQEGRAWS